MWGNKARDKKITMLHERIFTLESQLDKVRWAVRADIEMLAEALGYYRKSISKTEYVKKGGPEGPEIC